MVTGKNGMIDITEENLYCHHLLFIKDVVTSTFDRSNDCFKINWSQLSYRKARLNGLVVKVSDCNQETHVWLDDGTSVIRTLFSKNILLRKDSESIDIGTSLTVFGKVELFVENEIVLRCGGFKIEEDCTAEIYHWLKILQDRPPKKLQTKTVMFSSLSSYPSPNKIVTNEEFVESPIRDLDSQNTGYLWSPNHIFATSTPLRLNQQIISSPLNNKVHNGNLKPTNNIIQQDDPLNDDFHAVFDDDDDDDFDDFGEIDLVALEANAMKQIESSNKKRKWSLTME